MRNDVKCKGRNTFHSIIFYYNLTYSQHSLDHPSTSQPCKSYYRLLLHKQQIIWNDTVIPTECSHGIWSVGLKCVINGISVVLADWSTIYR